MESEERLIETLAADLEGISSYISDLMAAIPNPVYTVNAAGVIIDSNKALVELAGYPLEELLGRKAYTMFADETEAKSVEKETVEKGYVKGKELTLSTRDGKEIPVVIFTRARTDDSGNVFYVATLVDITERKQMQRVLQESERKYRELVENMAEGLCSIDEKRVVTFMNSKLCQMLGYKPEEVVGKHIYSFFDPENLKILKRELAQRPKGVSSQYEIAWTTKSGKQVPTFMSAIPIFDAQGIHRGSYVTVLDFTERKEEEQRRAQFISMLAHEMRTPLTPILSSGKLLAEQLEPKGEVGSRLAKNILKGAQTLSERLNEFLELSKTEMGLIKVNPQPLKAENLIERVVEQYLSVFTAKKQKFQVKMGKSLPCVLADEQRTSQVLSNLLSNANKFTPEGGQVTLRAKAEGNALVIEVEDNGPGIPLEQQTTLFQPYTHSDKFPGLGLGLAISKQLVELQGGKIWCHSQSGKGSIFGFSLPLAKETVDRNAL